MQEIKAGLIFDSHYGNSMRVRVLVTHYPLGGSPAIILVSDDHVREPVATLTCNFPGLKVALAPGEFAVKDWSENEGVADWLKRQKIAEPTGREIPSGFVSAPIFRFTAETQKILDSFKH